MKTSFTILIYLILALNLPAQKAEKIYSITKIQKDYTYYSQQAALWKTETENTPDNPEAWWNYYTAARMNNIMAGDKPRFDIKVIADDLKRNVPNTFEYHYVTYAQGNRDEEAYKHLEKAYEINPNRYEPWDSFITKAVFEGDEKTMKTFLEKLSKHELYSPGLAAWNYNVIVGLKPNALLITWGDNDTYPLWMLQMVKGIRQDVKVLNASLLFYPSYQQKIFKELNLPNMEQTLEEVGDYATFRDQLVMHILEHIDRPGYVGIGRSKSLTENYKDKLYLVGLAFEYCENDFDHIAVLRNNFEQLFLKDYLRTNLNNDFCQSVVDHMNQQYIPGFVVLYKHYRLSGETKKAEEIKTLLLDIGKKSNRSSEINDFLARSEQSSKMKK